MYRILLAEDDPALGNLLNDYLTQLGFKVIHCENGVDALLKISDETVDLCILDVMMPKKDGFTLAKQIRENDKEMPFIFLTAKSMLEDKVKGFKLGADDYITKPFHMEELELRINVILNRRPKTFIEADEKVYRLGSYSFNYPIRELSWQSETRVVSKIEAELLNVFYHNKGNLLRREYMLNLIWKNDDYYASRSMDVYITRIRKLLRNDPNLELVNLHGTGFKLIEKPN